MATETVRVRVYAIDKCGFYKWGASAPEFGSITSALSGLSFWTNGKALKDR